MVPILHVLFVFGKGCGWVGSVISFWGGFFYLQFIRDIGFVFDDTMSMAAQIRCVCQVAYCHIRCIATIRKCLSTIACKTIIHALVMSRLDFSNAMLYGLPKTQLRKLRMIQNSAARLITGTRRRDHITPVIYFTLVACSSPN